MIDYGAAIDSVQFSSKSELSLRFFGRLKFLVIFRSFVRSFVRSLVRSFGRSFLAFDRNGGARFGGARGRAGPHRFDQMQNESIFFNFWRRAAHRRQKSKKMRNENFWSRAQIKVQVMTMISVQFSSKSELSSGIFDPVKVCEKVSVRVPLSKMPSWIQNRNRHVCMALEQLVAFVIELLNLSRKKLKLTMFRRMPLGSAR